MSSDHFDALNYQISRQKALSAHIGNLANGTDAGFKRMPQPRTDTGAANAYVITITDAPAVYDGYVVIFKPTNTNTAASTINGVPITTDDGTALSGGELQAGHYYQLTYNGGSYEIVSSSIPAGSITEDKMELNGTRTDGYVWAWNAAAGKMEWVAQGTGADSGEVRMSSAASPMAFLGDVIGDGLEVSSGDLAVKYGTGIKVDGSGDLVSYASPNLFINPEGTIDQIGDSTGTPSSGTAIASGSYGLDGWKSFLNGSILTCNGTGSFVITGTGAIFGQYEDNLALRHGESVTISCATGTVEVLAGAGASATTVVPGTPYTFTLSMATTSDFVKLGEGTSCTGLKIEAGSNAMPYQRRSIGEEERLCWRYLCPIANTTVGSVGTGSNTYTNIGGPASAISDSGGPYDFTFFFAAPVSISDSVTSSLVCQDGSVPTLITPGVYDASGTLVFPTSTTVSGVSFGNMVKLAVSVFPVSYTIMGALLYWRFYTGSFGDAVLFVDARP